MTNHYPNEQDAEEMARRYGRGNERDALRARIEELEAKVREMAMQSLADLGQAQMAWEAQKDAEARAEALRKENERLQEVVDVAQEATKFARLDRDMYKAAVERLRKENERLRAAVYLADENVAFADLYPAGWSDLPVVEGDRRARAALQGETE